MTSLSASVIRFALRAIQWAEGPQLFVMKPGGRCPV